MYLAKVYVNFRLQLYTLYIYKLSKKRNVLLLSTAFIFSKLNMCKYLYEHNKIQQLRHKLNKFHRHVTNRNGIMCP